MSGWYDLMHQVENFLEVYVQSVLGFFFIHFLHIGPYLGSVSRLRILNFQLTQATLR